jgi:hypothetical protein
LKHLSRPSVNQQQLHEALETWLSNIQEKQHGRVHYQSLLQEAQQTVIQLLPRVQAELSNAADFYQRQLANDTI